MEACEMNIKEIQEKALKHYSNMQEAVKWYADMDAEPSHEWMSAKTGETWRGVDCAYCKHYTVRGTEKCPLNPYTHDRCFGFTCCLGAWKKMNQATTWREWFKYSEEVVEYIKNYGLEEGGENESIS
jgi:hypothetical protein